MRGSIYEAAGGRRGITALAEAWHRRALADPIVSHAFAHGFNPEHTDRLAAYWAEALGGPAEYTTSMGDQSSVVRMHSGNGEHREMDERALELFGLAVDEAGLGADRELRDTLVAYFAWATTLMNAHPHSADAVPQGLPMARWSWDGPVRGAR